MSTATLDASSETTTKDAKALSCPHCRKQFAPLVDPTQPPRLQGAKCPHCKLFVPSKTLAARFAKA